ncbi:SURF1 family protein [Vreelandella aquamarina]
MIKPSDCPARIYGWYVFWSAIVILGLFLGLWQWERANDKRELMAMRDAAPTLEEPTETPMEGGRVILRGDYLEQYTLYLDNRIANGRLGVAVLTPLRDAYGQLWLIQRGFIETGASRAPPSAPTPEGVVEVSGEWQDTHGEGQLFGVNQEGVRLQQMSLEPWEASLGPFSHDGWLHAEHGAGVFTPWWEANVMPPSRHLGYAVQWWGLALAALVVMLLGGQRLIRDYRVRQ